MSNFSKQKTVSLSGQSDSPATSVIGGLQLCEPQESFKSYTATNNGNTEIAQVGDMITDLNKCGPMVETISSGLSGKKRRRRRRRKLLDVKNANSTSELEVQHVLPLASLCSADDDQPLSFSACGSSVPENSKKRRRIRRKCKKKRDALEVESAGKTIVCVPPTPLQCLESAQKLVEVLPVIPQDLKLQPSASKTDINMITTTTPKLKLSVACRQRKRLNFHVTSARLLILADALRAAAIRRSLNAFLVSPRPAPRSELSAVLFGGRRSTTRIAIDRPETLNVRIEFKTSAKICTEIQPDILSPLQIKNELQSICPRSEVFEVNTVLDGAAGSAGDGPDPEITVDKVEFETVAEQSRKSRRRSFLSVLGRRLFKAVRRLCCCCSK